MGNHNVIILSPSHEACAIGNAIAGSDGILPAEQKAHIHRGQNLFSIKAKAYFSPIPLFTVHDPDAMPAFQGNLFG